MPVAPVVVRTTLFDRQYYGSGQYMAYASPWCSYIDPTLKVGVALVDTISFVQDTMPNGVDITAQVPNEDPNLHGCGVYGFNFLAYGDYDGGAGPLAVKPQQVSAIGQFTERFAWHPTAGATDNYNVLNEFFVTSVEGDSNAKVAEIGLLLHAAGPIATFARNGVRIGSWNDSSGRLWTITRQGTFIMVMPADGKDVLSGTIDFGNLLKYLVSRAALTGKEWVNGAAIGLEPVRNNSAVTIDSWSISLS